MAGVTCPDCKNSNVGIATDYDDTLQCSKCGTVLRVVVRKGHVTDVRVRRIALDVPKGLPADLEKILNEAISCAEIGSNGAALVLAGLFMEGLLANAGFKGRLVDQVKAAQQKGVLSRLGYSLADATRMMHNMGAHYSSDLADLSESDARLALEMARATTVRKPIGFTNLYLRHTSP